ncbi:MAG TPA: hypothetical protein VKP65_08040 [Rhodothermales bacterium]|nr:hypothetical protein [Rhodothermales bacterium]
MRWYITLFAVAFMLVGVQSARACSCVMPPPPTEALAASDAVFLGQVIKTRRDGSGINKGNLFATIRILQIWKGDLEEEVVIETGPNSAACGVPFQKGQEYLVYASVSAGHLRTHLCTRTTQAKNADADVEALGDGTILSQEDAPRGGCGGMTNFGALQGVFFIFLWIGFRSRRRR